MITRKQVIKAWKIVCQSQVLPTDEVERQLVSSLLVYKRRGELGGKGQLFPELGSLDNAIKCLELAGYEIEAPGIPCSKCGAVLQPHWLKDGVCNACRNPHLVVKALVS